MKLDAVAAEKRFILNGVTFPSGSSAKGQGFKSSPRNERPKGFLSSIIMLLSLLSLVLLESIGPALCVWQPFSPAESIRYLQQLIPHHHSRAVPWHKCCKPPPAACCLCRPPKASMGELLVRLHCPCHATPQDMQHPSSCHSHQCLPIPCSASLLQAHPAFGKRMAMLGKVRYIWVGCAVAVLHIEVSATCLRSPPAASPCQQDPVSVIPTTMQATEVFQQRLSFEIRRGKKKKKKASSFS